MKRAIEHSTDLLQAALDGEHRRQWPETRTIAALAHAIGMQRLLVTYLLVTDPDDRDGGAPDAPQ
jgi:hypothetical protein